jgi:hypothetical protein
LTPLAGLQVVAVRPDRADARATAEQVFAGPAISRADLIGVHGPRPGSGRADGEFWQADPWFLKTRAVLGFAASSAAVAALERLFARKTALGALVPPRSIFVVTTGSADGFQVWTLAPRLVTLRERMDDAAAAGRWEALARALAGFALGLGEAVSASLDAGLCLDASPANFAACGGRLRYIDDDVAASHDALGVEDAFVARFTEYAAPEAVWLAYAQRFARELALRVTPGALARLRFAVRLKAAASLRRGSAPYVERVLAALELA